MNSSRLNIWPLSKLQTFVKDYPDENLHQQLGLLAETFPMHRAVRGDGNCFYRAFAYLYLTNCTFTNYQSAFPPVKKQYFKENSQIQTDEQFQQKLQRVYYKYLSNLSTRNENERQALVEGFFNQVQQFDELMIGYFRSVNYFHLKKNQAEFLPFIRDTDTFQEQLSRVVKFGSESEGVEIFSLANAMKIKIIIFCIDYNGFQPVSYMQELQDEGFYLFFRPGHYDIVYQQKRIQQQYKKQGFLSSVKKSIKNTFIKNKQSQYNKKQQDTPRYQKINKLEQETNHNKKKDDYNRIKNNNYQRFNERQSNKICEQQIKRNFNNQVQQESINIRTKTKIIEKESNELNQRRIFDSKYNSSTTTAQTVRNKRRINLQSNSSNFLNELLAISSIALVIYSIYSFLL